MKEIEHIWINGKYYPMWEQFVLNKADWIGGILRDYDSNEYFKGIITDITLEENGEDTAFFSVESKDFGCGGSTDILGFTGTVN